MSPVDNPASVKSRRAFARDVVRLVWPYWVSEERWSAIVLLVSIVALNLALVYLNVQFNYWNNDFYNALQEKNEPVFWEQFIRFGWLAALFIAAAVARMYLNMWMQIRWRRWLTQHYIADWLADRAYYRIQLKDYGTDNPDQRIAEDVRLFVDNTLSLSLDLLSSVVTLVSFVGILWSLSGPLGFTLFGQEIVVPGYMVWVAILYCLVGSLLTHVIGRRLIPLNFVQQRREADFRFGLMRLRENAEGVALYGGEAEEARGLGDLFEVLRQNWWSIMNTRKNLTFFSVLFSQLANVFPFIVAAPRYFSGAIQLGGLMQIASAFGQVQGALSWFVESYAQLAEWKATVDRLTQFRAAVDAARAEALATGITVERGASDAIEIEDLDLETPVGRALVRDASIALTPGEATLITGPSGSGKSTLFRALAGIWPFGRGTVRVPEGARSLFLPQRPYLPIGSLRAAVSYPSLPGAFPDDAMVDALNAAGLHGLAGTLDEEAHWGQRLSPGEQQRVAVARALLNRPDWLFLDEATSALDEATEQRVMAVLMERLPGTTIVSIAHRPALTRVHARRLVLEGADGAPRVIATAAAE
jgi:putative ATP-binding cassette transporter